MKINIYFLFFTLMVVSCSSSKKLESIAPFDLGEPFAQEWKTADESEQGFELIIPITSLELKEAELKNLYFQGKMAPVVITLTELGNVAIAEFGQKSTKTGPLNPSEPFPFELLDTQAVISYVSNDKVKYYKVNGVSQKIPITYSDLEAKNNR
ncbi:hypothetical protein [Cytophaga sp. FL35]|uniref:hypothetical protein n=1 Tax=Cytophaga sp. FL35 TaxID=1904456 RepID=UPI001653ED6F|nr:hypothetical protein [Cytophaga sp. FL35]MBC6997511.1 hypothetical protein [Cytophaga sp. FL35]